MPNFTLEFTFSEFKGANGRKKDARNKVYIGNRKNNND